MSAMTIFRGVASTPDRPPTVCLLIILPTKEDSSCYTVIRFAFVLLVANRIEKHTLLFFTPMPFIPDRS